MPAVLFELEYRWECRERAHLSAHRKIQLGTVVLVAAHLPSYDSRMQC